MLAWNGSLGVSRFFGIASPAYCVYQFNSGSAPWYFHHLLRSSVYKSRIRAVSTGIVESRLRLYTDDLYRLEAFVPPQSEQIAIVRFLGYADRRVRRYIRAKEKLIALLEEQKQAIIHQAVTGRIDVRTGQPYPTYKPSGVEWLGDVPAHWKIRKLGQCGSSIGGMTPSMEIRRYWDGDVPWVTPKDMKMEAIGDSSTKVSETALSETSLRLIDPPAVLMVVRGMILARKVPISWTTDPVTINQDMKALIPNPDIDAEFFARMLASAQDAFASLIDVSGHGTRRLPTERWRALALAIPPKSEQVLIVRSLTKANIKIDEGVSCVRREVELLREYRIRLIADVVTGKLDVRGATAELPEVDPLAGENDMDMPFDADREPAFDRAHEPADAAA